MIAECPPAEQRKKVQVSVAFPYDTLYQNIALYPAEHQIHFHINKYQQAFAEKNAHISTCLCSLKFYRKFKYLFEGSCIQLVLVPWIPETVIKFEGFSYGREEEKTDGN